MLAATFLLFLLPTSASACSCRRLPVAERVEEAAAVYIASPRLPDLWPGRSFRVERTLKGPPRHNLRVEVYGGVQTFLMASEDACEARPLSEPYVLMVDAGNSQPGHISWCSEHMAGDAAVAEAIATLGEGESTPWRPDPLWLISWLLPVGAVVGVVVLRRRRRARTAQATDE